MIDKSIDRSMGSALSPPSSYLFASIDMGTNSFKLLIIRAFPDGVFFPIHRHKEAVVLGRDAAAGAISPQSQALALQSLGSFSRILQTHNVIPSRTACLATSAIREASNKGEFVAAAEEALGLGFRVRVLSGEEEAELAYKGAIQFLPVYEKLILNVDIGGGSTEFTIGKRGEVLYCASLKLGHVTLTQESLEHGEFLKLREHIVSAVEKSGLVHKVKQFGFEVAVGSSGTIRELEKAEFCGYWLDDGIAPNWELKRQWRLSRRGLTSIVERLCCADEKWKEKRDRFFGKRTEFILAGAILLEEIFNLLGIEEMDVSKYALGEAAIADTLSKVYSDYASNANVRWQSIIRLATRLNSKKQMRAAAQCAGFAREIFEGLRKEYELCGKDLEYLQAACLLHGIGLLNGRKGYHKQTYHMIMDSDKLHGYEFQEVKFIALLAKHHRKKFPGPDHASLQDLPEEMKENFRFLCSIIRVSVALRQDLLTTSQNPECSYANEGLDLLLHGSINELSSLLEMVCPLEESRTKEELMNFRKVFKRDLSAVVKGLVSVD
ncbi:hypothetical protein SAY86_013368 [Trapa natans]|uniref:Exopolyphosphatase n=1 Tax=Trapa natans TaxID=22666 RepID=A0AAN7M163_TRANT|nr:hypothetical protein SAY86_013368 [Trapa natans]